MSIFATNFSEGNSTQNADMGQFGQQSAIPKMISERHVACVFLLDVSGSMVRNDAIGKLNEGMVAFRNHMQNDERTSNVVDTAIVAFGKDVSVVQNWRPVSEMDAPILSANGQTPLGAALRKGLELIEERKSVYKKSGTPYYRPWIFCITDGIPTDDWQDSSKKLKEAEDNKKVVARCVCIENNSNFSRAELHKIFNPGRVLKLESLDFSGLFEFVSSSLAAVSQSAPNAEKINVAAPHTLTLDM